MAIADFRLYLPESWAADSDRCNKAKIPEEHRIYQPKWCHALEMVKHARQLGLRYGWVGSDSLYGSIAAFINELDDLGEIFMADINKSTKVWTSELTLHPPASSGEGRGRPRKWPQLHEDNSASYISVGKLVEEEFQSGHRQLSYRQGAKGKLTTRFWARPVWCWEKGWATARLRMLVVRRDADDAFKYSLTNLIDRQDWEHYAWMQGQRFWIEHAFHEAKSQLGMAMYQVRGRWRPSGDMESRRGHISRSGNSPNPQAATSGMKPATPKSFSKIVQARFMPGRAPRKRASVTKVTPDAT